MQARELFAKGLLLLNIGLTGSATAGRGNAE